MQTYDPEITLEPSQPDPHTLITQTFTTKYSYSQPPKIINQLIQQALSSNYIKYRDECYYYDEQQFMRRQYLGTQYEKKIVMLSEYYKFHRDLPVWNDRQVEQIMGRYYSKVKDTDYKKIKDILKRQQGISLTTHQSFSSFDQSDYTKKSRYSTMLNQLDNSADSVLLRDLCDKIGDAFKKVKAEDNFKGSYYSGEKKFEEFLRKQKKRKQNTKQDKKTKNQPRLKLPQKQKPKQKQAQGLKQILLSTNNHTNLKDQRSIRQPTKISIHKTINDTNSREQKPRIKQVQPTSSRSSLSYKKSVSKQHLLHFNQNVNIKSKSKIVKTFNIADIINNQNINAKSTTQIYKCTEKSGRKEYIAGQLQRKQSAKVLQTKMRSRSNSTNNLQTQACLTKNKSKKQLMINSVKTNRSSSRKSIPISIVKGSVIELAQSHQQKNINKDLPIRQNSQKSLRTTSKTKTTSQQKQIQSQSHSNINHIRTQSHTQFQTTLIQLHTQPPIYPQTQYNTRTSTNQKIFGKKRNSVIENMLQKKLFAFKRKQAVL